ncbi:MAG: hypothetical protein HOH74_26915 [Gemmatimonadetes bacterium]|jgi:hypothetical protein|nr:hypothetical protein [Gemmatimonadota bacterium]MBT6149098.1 hypothetical protein [Gemmatimonadota bacterium]
MRIGIPDDFRRYLSMRGVSVTKEEEEHHQPLTGRALAVGSFLSFFLAVGANYADIVIKGSYMTLDFSTPGAIFLFLVLVGGLNSLFKVTARRPWIGMASAATMAVIWLVHFYPYSTLVLHSPGVLFGSFLVVAFTANAVLALSGRNMALNRSELIVVYIMLVVVASLATMGLCETILPAISGFFYYANPENKWEELLIPHLPPQIVVNDGASNTTFFEGFGTANFTIPWSVWLRPMGMWGIFLIGLYLAMVCTVVILRRQWMDRERLSYPLVQAAQVMIRGEDPDRAVNPFFRSKAMWAGAALPILVGLFTGLNKYLGGFPIIPTAWTIPLGFGQSLNMTLSFAVVGFSYLIGPDIAMGIWGFALLSKLEKALLIANGVTKQQDVWSVRVTELINYQGLGALVVFVLIGLWVGREHLREVWLSFLGRDSKLSDDDEIMSYRAAVGGLLIGLIVMVGWFVYLGTPLWASVLYIALLMTIFTGLSRVVAESGVAAIITPMNASDFMIYGMGGKLIGVKAVTTFSLGYIFAADIRVFLMGVVANGLKLIEGMNTNSRRIVSQAIAIAIFLGMAGSLYTVLALAYRDGGINTSGWFFKSMPAVIARTAVHGLELDPTYWPGLGFTGLGAGAMLGLTWIRQRFLWWPLHPIGFPIMTSWVVDWMWFSIFFAWLIKVIILKYGGADLFTRSRDFFLGLIVGRMFISGGWLVVDYLTGTVSNPIFWI